MTAQTKTLIVGAGALAATRFYFKQPWMMSALAAAAVVTVFLVVTDVPETTT